MPTLAEPIDLQTGDRMTREEFHRIYEQTPRKFKAELIGGIVYVASPLRRRHGNRHIRLGALISIYEGNTPGTEAGGNVTILLGDHGEPQPDVYLRILPEYGGQSRTTSDDYVAGAPELIAEVADSSRSIDLHGKREDYARYGVLEYIVAGLRDNRLHWFDLRTGSELTPDPDGICRIQTFPGLWIDGPALLAQDFPRAMNALSAGLATPEHAAFVQRLLAANASGRQ